MATRSDPMYAGYRHPGEVISYAVHLYYRLLKLPHRYCGSVRS